jgi:hypothetical protein
LRHLRGRSGPGRHFSRNLHVNQNGPTAAFDYQRVCARSATLTFVK